MGTTLTGTTPQDTYDSLIKVTDNGPLSGTAKYLSDGLGNDSVLSLSTANVGVGVIPSANIGNLQIGGTANGSIFSQQGTDTVRAGVRASGRVGIVFDSSDATYTNRMWYLDSFGANGSLTIGRQGLDVMTFANAGNVGIGASEITTSTYAGKLSVFTTGGGNIAVGGATNTNNAIVSRIVAANANNGNAGNESSAEFRGVTSIESAIVTTDSNAGGDSGGYIVFKTKPEAGALTEVGRFLATGGLTFNGDTAAANALDDYEEGTWTMGLAFGGASVGVTYVDNTGAYTKIGRQVTVTGYLALSSKGSSTGSAFLTGLPFTISNSNSAYSISSLRFTTVTFANQFQAQGVINTTTIEFSEITEAGVLTALTDADFANNSTLIVSFTYFV
jgi:hypothetical protein